MATKLKNELEIIKIKIKTFTGGQKWEEEVIDYHYIKKNNDIYSGSPIDEDASIGRKTIEIWIHLVII